MKTITLTEEAYERLKDWKTDARDSFSRVVLRVVPMRGTLSDMIENFKQLPPLNVQQASIMTATTSGANDWASVNDPWSEEQDQASEDGVRA